MSILDKLKTATHRVVTFPNQGLAFMVKPISSVDLAEHKVAGLVMVAGKKTDHERTRLASAALDAQKVLAQQQAWHNWSQGDKAGEEPPKPEQDALLDAMYAVQQNVAYQAAMMGPEKARKSAEINKAMAVAGVVKVRTGEDQWQPCTLVEGEESREVDGRVFLNVVDVAPYIKQIAQAVVAASTEEAGKVMAAFPGESGPAADA